MDSALLIHRLHFAFTVTFHYLFPQLTMGLAPLIVVLKTIALRRNDETYHQAARFWARIFGINFVIGVVTGIPMEFQFGTNWSHFSRFAGGVIGQTLAMEGMSYFVCPHCNHEIDIFSRGGAERTAQQFGVPFLGSIQLDPELRKAGDSGKPAVLEGENSPLAKSLYDFTRRVISRLDEIRASAPESVIQIQ